MEHVFAKEPTKFTREYHLEPWRRERFERLARHKHVKRVWSWDIPQYVVAVYANDVLIYESVVTKVRYLNFSYEGHFEFIEPEDKNYFERQAEREIDYLLYPGAHDICNIRIEYIEPEEWNAAIKVQKLLSR